MDVFTRMIRAWQLRQHLTQSLTLKPLEEALCQLDLFFLVHGPYRFATMTCRIPMAMTGLYFTIMQTMDRSPQIQVLEAPHLKRIADDGL